MDAYRELLINDWLPAGPQQQPTMTTEDAGGIRFATTIRGYSFEDVDALVTQAGKALESKEPGELATARAAVQARKLRVKFRGYDRAQVDHHLADLAHRLAAAGE